MARTLSPVEPIQIKARVAPENPKATFYFVMQKERERKRERGREGETSLISPSFQVSDIKSRERYLFCLGFLYH